jgi:hypothetical protein
MWRAPASRRQPVALGIVSLLLAASCGDRARDEEGVARDGERPAEAPPIAGAEPATRAEGAAPSADGDVAELGRVLGSATGSDRLGDAERIAAEQAMQRVLSPLLDACEGCRTGVSYVDEPGGGDYLRCELRSSDGAAIADLHVFHRPDLPSGAARSWTSTELHGHPASVAAGERLFVWPGRFEIRAFARSEPLGAERGLEDLIGRLPLDALARL